MNLRRLTARSTAAGATAALAAGALVGLGAPAAQAAPAENTYTCTIAQLGEQFDTTLTATGTLPAKGLAGAPVKAKAITLTASAAVSSEVAQLLKNFGVESARSDDFTLAVGKAAASVPLSGGIVTEGEGEAATTSWRATGASKAFTAPAAGTTQVRMPAKFNFVAEASVGDVPIPCVLKSGEKAESLGAIALAKQKTTTKATAPVVKAGKRGKVVVSVKGQATTPVGKVVVKKGKKVVGKAALKKGKATVKLAKLGKGKHKLVVSYQGNGTFKASSKKVTLRVK